MSDSAQAHKETIHALATALGFDAFGVATIPDGDEPERLRFLEWIARGAHGDMTWLERSNERRLFPKEILPGAKSVICLGLNYYRFDPPRIGEGILARYSAGRDYHRLLYKKQKKLCAQLRAMGAVNKPYVDTGPVLEKAFAARAGLGWQGRNSLLIHERFGPWMLLGVIFTTLALPPDKPAVNRCGSCRRCIDACPTGALREDGFMDARRCLAYLTIEHKGPLSLQDQAATGNCLLGCDRCANACPWGRRAPSTREEGFVCEAMPSPLRELLLWDEDTFRAHFAGQSLLRAGWDGWRRNMLAVLSNVGQYEDLAAIGHVADTAAENWLRQLACQTAQTIRTRTLLTTTDDEKKP